MKKFPEVVFLFIFLLILACDKKGYYKSCKECLPTEPVSVTIKVILDHGHGIYGSSEINVFEGNLEDSILFRRFTAEMGPLNFTAPANKQYTIAVTYYIDGIYYTAINSVRPRIRDASDKCDRPCFFVYNNEVNMNLR